MPARNRWYGFDRSDSGRVQAQVKVVPQRRPRGEQKTSRSVVRLVEQYCGVWVVAVSRGDPRLSRCLGRRRMTVDERASVVGYEYPTGVAATFQEPRGCFQRNVPSGMR